MRFASFNVYGIGGKSITDAISYATQQVCPTDANNHCIAFQEVWTPAQLKDVVAAYPSAAAQPYKHANVDIWRAREGKWRCLVPRTKPVPSMPLASGLALCIHGAVHDAFFMKFRGGAVPDVFSKKGVLCALATCSGQPKRAFINTHLHDYSNDRFGKYRYANLDSIVSAVKWIREHWRVPIVMLGDFNIDAIGSYTRSSEPDFRCYSRLIRAGLAEGATWYDVNARVNRGAPVKTTNSKAIDHHLLLDAPRGDWTFTSSETPHSDHRLTVSERP